MDESVLNSPAEASAGKPKKSVKRAVRAEVGETVAKKPRVTKPRATKAAKTTKGSKEAEPSLFEAAPPVATPAPFSPVYEPRVEPIYVERAAPVTPERMEPVVHVESSPPVAERSVFVPSSEKSDTPTSSPAPEHFPVESADAGPVDPSSVVEVASGFNSDVQVAGRDGASAPNTAQQEEERGPWWKRKKDKKAKWKDKPHNGAGGHPSGHSGGHAGGRPGGHQHPPQPLPPVLAPKHYGDLPNPARFADLVALDALAETLRNGNGDEPIQVDKIYALNLFELTVFARNLGLVFDVTPNRLQALEAIFFHAAEKSIPLREKGFVELTEQGHGFIVHEQSNYRLYPESTYLPEVLIKRFALKRGHSIEVVVQPPQSGDRCMAAVSITSVMGKAPGEIAKLTPFEELVPYYPLQRILLEAPEIHKDISMRAVDLLTPIGFGQRGLLVAPPRTGKTVLLQNIANSISHNFPEKKLILLLIDERPEEVTDFKRHTTGEVVSSTFDEAPESHVHAAEMVIEKARRLVEQGEHVVILLDSITRLARAYNALAANSGKIMSGGVEANALQKPKRFFGSARNIEGGGSITIIGTALVDTGSRMDEVIFEEFKGTGNMELHLDRGLSDKRIFPAINIDRSGTRKEELIYHPEEMLRVYGLRRAMQGIPPVEAMDMFIQRLKKTKTNAEFLMSLNR
jgi:transcription termination factor Rho